MSDLSGVLTPVAISAVINGISKYRTHGAAGTFQVVFGNLALFTMLGAIGQLWRWDIAKMFAIIYLVATFLTAGKPAIDWFSELVDGVSPAAKSKS